MKNPLEARGSLCITENICRRWDSICRLLAPNLRSHPLSHTPHLYGDRLSNISQDIFDRLVYNNQINENYLAKVLLPEFLISIAIDQQNLTNRKDCEAFFNGIVYNIFILIV